MEPPVWQTTSPTRNRFNRQDFEIDPNSYSDLSESKNSNSDSLPSGKSWIRNSIVTMFCSFFSGTYQLGVIDAILFFVCISIIYVATLHCSILSLTAVNTFSTNLL